jgi:uracil-DNA glycosylase
MARSKLDELRQGAAGCTACDLYKTGTQVVLGETREREYGLLVGDLSVVAAWL